MSAKKAGPVMNVMIKPAVIPPKITLNNISAKMRIFFAFTNLIYGGNIHLNDLEVTLLITFM